MQAIPVIDLMGGRVVRARMGDRASYRPLESPLSPTSDAVAVVRGLLAVYPFPTLYVADLDAIEGDGDNFPTLRRIRAEFPYYGAPYSATEQEGVPPAVPKKAASALTK